MVNKTPVEKGQKILLIEGNTTLAEQISEALKANGFRSVFVANSGHEGLQKIYDILPHLILLDVDLSDLSGYEILNKKQTESLLAKIPVFLLSTTGVPINMRDIPAGSINEVIISLQASSDEIIDKINAFFGYKNSEMESAPLSGEVNSTGKRLLWVEDDRLIGTILGKKLVTTGFNLVHAKSGAEALESLKTRRPDGIIVDLLLPEMSGFEILEKIRDDEDLKGVPIMVLSNLSKSTDIEKARSLGATKFLVKASTSLDQIVVEVKSLVK